MSSQVYSIYIALFTK